MRFLVAGASTFSVDNLGDDAMFAALVQSLRRVDPVAEVRLLARHPSRWFDEYFGAKSIQNLEHGSNEAATGRMFMGFNPADDNVVLQRVYSEIQTADALILAGNLFMEVSVNEHLRGVSSYAALLTIFAQLAGTPIIVFGLNVVDAMSSELVVQQARHVLGAASEVGLREEATSGHLREAGLHSDRMVVLGDPAVGLLPHERLSSDDADVLSQIIGTPTSSKPVTVSLCIRSEYWNDPQDCGVTTSTLQVLSELLEKGVRIRAVPNCTYQGGHALEDDRASHRRLFGALNNDIDFVEERLGVFETIQLLSNSDAHITNRRHSAILAAHADTWAIPIATSHATHMSGFAHDIGLGEHLMPDLEGALRMVSDACRSGIFPQQTQGSAFAAAADRARAAADEFFRRFVENRTTSRNPMASA